MDIKEIHDLIDKITKKEINGWFSPKQKDMALHQASLWAFNERYKRYATDQEAMDDLAPFKKSYHLLPENTPGGMITMPSEYAHFLGGYIQSFDNERSLPTYNGFDIVNDDELPGRLSSMIVPVTEIERVGQWLGRGKIQLWPKTPAAGYLSYLKTPDAPSMAFDMDGRKLIYKAGDSTQLEWDDDNTLNLILPRALSILDASLAATNITNFMEAIKA